MDSGPTTKRPFEPAHMNDALPVGTRLGGYQIIEVLGRGGFGIVYLALDSSLQRQVAIKEYLPAELAMRCDDGQVWVRPGADVTAYGAGMTAFLNEAKMLARFDHPSLARVLTFWEENRSAYMVMPYYDGRTLAALLAEMPRPPNEAWLRSLLTPLLSALSALHNADCLHLDISPDNILVMSDGRPVLLDFGVASRLATDKTMPLTALLNPAYAPIEQYSETATLPQGPWSDLYALASVLHFAIAGVPPARATVRAMGDPQRPLAETVAARAEQFPGLSYSASFLTAIDKALAVKPRERPRSAAEFQFLFDLFAAREGVFNSPHASGAAGAAAQATPAWLTPSPSQQPSSHHTSSHQTSPQTPPQASPPPFSALWPEPSEPSLHAAPDREAWVSAEPKDAPTRPRRSRAPLWIASVAALGLAAVGGWAWLQRQPSFAYITVADLPAAVVASIPKPASESASAVTSPEAAAAALEAAPTGAGPAPVAPTSEPADLPAAPAATPPTATAPTQPAANDAAEDSDGKNASTAEPPTPTPRNQPAPGAKKPAAKESDTDKSPKATAQASNKRTVKPTTALPPEPTTPRAACGARANFALVYCLQQQCKRWKFNTHPQCLELERAGEL